MGRFAPRILKISCRQEGSGCAGCTKGRFTFGGGCAILLLGRKIPAPECGCVLGRIAETIYPPQGDENVQVYLGIVDGKRNNLSPARGRKREALRQNLGAKGKQSIPRKGTKTICCLTFGATASRNNLSPARGRKHLCVCILPSKHAKQSIPRKGTKTVQTAHGSMGMRETIYPPQGDENFTTSCNCLMVSETIYPPQGDENDDLKEMQPLVGRKQSIPRKGTKTAHLPGV